MRCLLKYDLGIPPDSTMLLDDVLAHIETYINGQLNEALCRLAFTQFKQAEGESLTDFFVRLQQLSEETDLCKGVNCVKAKMKHAILVPIRNEELTKKLISMPTTVTLDEVKLTCRAFKAAKKTMTELKAPQTSVRVMSNYKKLKKAFAKPEQPKKNHQQEKTPSISSRCKNCGQQHYSDTSICLVALRPLSCPSPPINLHVTYGSKSWKINVISDTGADTNVFGVQLLQAFGINVKELSPPPELQFSNADGSPIKAFQEDVKTELEAMVAQGITEAVRDQPSPWCHPLVVVAKPTGGVCVNTVLSKIPLAEEDQALTTFITPYGRYHYRRSPMGFSASGDAYCRRGDIALQGIQHCVKVGDYILVYDKDYYSHLCRLNNVLSRCRTHSITLNAEKFVIASPTLSFLGYTLPENGIAADEEKVQAISEFPKPVNLRDFRSLMGFTIQLTEFSPDLAAAADLLRPLMSHTRSFTWTADHDAAFASVKRLSLSSLC
ncbi:uncharacterized protein [Palaemon carinicauda]|uniref:uncharacterized protein n=1 Tax=Palaemon carinicauda TaxID=392227 RepID=UPI0035B69061